MKRQHIIIAILAIALASAPLAGQPLTLKVATFVPTNSPWDIGLKKLAAEFDRISGGRVKLSFPQSLKNATQSDIIQKMNLGIDGALLDTTGLSEIYPGILAISMPSLVRTDAELQSVLKAVTPLVRQRLSENYVVLAIARAGWVRFFSADPIVYPEDISRLKVATSPSEDRISRLLQAVGAKTVKCDTPTMILQLNSKAIDSFYFSPIFTASIWPQVKGKVNYMTSFKVCPFIGAILFTKSSWAKVPPELRGPLEDAVKAAAMEMDTSTDKIENDAISALKNGGCILPPYPADADARWNALYSGKIATLMSELFPKEMLDAISGALQAARKGK